MECPVALIQVRLSSSRLPGKSLLPLAGQSVLSQVAARAAKFASQVVVCTSTDPSDDPLELEAAKLKLCCVRGPLDDVFARFRGALLDPRVNSAPWFARVTGDCPLVSASLARACLAEVRSAVDYISVDHSALPRGLAVELVRREAFLAIDPATLDGPEREHVTLRLYERTAGKGVVRAPIPPALAAPDLRLTLDYAEDYELLRELFRREPGLEAERAIELLRAEPALAAINAKCEQKSAR